MKRSFLVAMLAGLAILVSLLMLERERSGLSVTRIEAAGAPVTIWRPDDAGPLPRVVVAHGYAGSRQMMRAIALTLARSGLEVAALDLPGHGRHPEPMTGDVTSLDGATAMLTREVVAVARALAERPGDGLALLGHSMATDIVVRAAESLGPGSVVAISMYSEAVTSESPARLLILSGAREGRLRENALEAVRMVEPDAEEGETVTGPGVVRRAAVAPLVGHVGVLYAPSGLIEARDWIAAPFDPVAGEGQPPATAIWLLLLLGGVVAAAWPLTRVLGPAAPQPAGPTWKLAATAVALPAPLATAAAIVTPDLLGLLAFGPLAAFLAVWGAVQTAILWRAGRRLARPRLDAALVLIAWSAVFAWALDRYGAAFVPTGLRLEAMALLLPGALLFAYGDALLTTGARLPMRLLTRAIPLAALLAAMALHPLLGVAFTVLPVIVLFWLVFGTAAGWVAMRAGRGTAAPVLGFLLAYAIAASTPTIAI